MQTTTFRCGHCNNLMAVSSQYLGQQVQCPTCKQVVVAPQAEPTPPPEPSLPTLPNLPLQPIQPPALSLDTEQESIFSTPSIDDDLFDDPAPVMAATIEYRLDPAPVQMQNDPEPEPPPISGWQPDSQPDQVTNFPTVHEVSSPLSTRTENEPDYRESERELPGPSRARAKRGNGENWLILFMIPLASYSVLATLLIFYLWNRIEAVRNSQVNTLESMPDVNGDAPGAKKNEKRVLTWKADDTLALAPLSPNRKARLVETLVCENLEIKPIRVEQKVVGVYVEGYPNPEPCLHESLVLYFALRNLSTEYAFVPMENSFDRYWTGGKVTDSRLAPLDAYPLTVFQVGATNYFGGPAKWFPWRRTGKLAQERREWIEGRTNHDITPLEPGEKMETFICTDGGEKGKSIVPTAMAHKGDLVWRVQFRQGPIDIKGRAAPVPTTTVVGISFAPSEVIRIEK